MDSTVPNFRLTIDRLSNLPSIHSFGQVSEFLREAYADEDSRLLSESLAQLALHAEAVVAGLRLDRRREHAAPLLMDMLTVLREHSAVVANLGLEWRSLYEYAGYQQALNNLRVLLGERLLHVHPWEDRLDITADEFERLAWRTLGEGMLLVDMYEQLRP